MANEHFNLDNINVTTMNGSASFNVGNFTLNSPASSQNQITRNMNSNNNNSMTNTTQIGGDGAFNSGNNNQF